MQKLLHREVSTRRSLYTQKLLTQRSLSTVELLHTDAFTRRSFYTHRRFYADKSSHRGACVSPEKSLHRGAFTHRCVFTAKFITQSSCYTAFIYTEEILHTEVSTQKLSTTAAFTQRSLDTEELLHTEAFTQRSLCTEELSHTESFA